MKLTDGNKKRAKRALSSLRFGKYVERVNLEPEAIIDVLTDLMHLCRGRDLDFDHLLSVATDHFSEETPDV